LQSAANFHANSFRTHLDAIVANSGEAQDVYLNDGGGVFTAHPNAPTFGRGTSAAIALGDIDSDGDLDAIVANWGEAQTVWLNRNSADLSITKSVTAPSTSSGQETSTAPGGSITYTLVFSNSGPQAANNVLISDSVPLDVIVGAQWSAGVALTRTPGMTFEWTVGRLAPGQGGVITITGVLTSPLSRGYVFSNTASITTTDVDSDLSNNSDSAAVTVSDVAPVAVDDGGAEYITDEDSAFETGNVLANDYDANGDALAVSGFDASGTLGLLSDNGDGTFEYDPNGQFEYLDRGQQALDNFSYVLGGGTGTLADAAVVTITINGINDAPTANDDSASTPQDTPVTIAVLDNDSDPENDALSVSALGLPSNGESAIAGLRVVYTPTQDFDGPDSFTYTVSDGQLSDTARVNVQVQPLGATSDLAVSQSYTRNAGVVTYTVVARNLGPDAANGAVFSSTLSAHVSGVSWTCAAAGGAACPAGSGAGNNVNATLASFPASGVLTYTLSGALDPAEDAVNTASITPPVGVTDPDEDNNSSTLSTANYQVFLPLVVRSATP
jgi:uncharacterized repeat protein (TIGR01451 family)